MFYSRPKLPSSWNTSLRQQETELTVVHVEKSGETAVGGEKVIAPIYQLARASLPSIYLSELREREREREREQVPKWLVGPKKGRSETRSANISDCIVWKILGGYKT